METYPMQSRTFIGKSLVICLAIFMLSVLCGFKSAPATRTTPAQYTELGNVLTSTGDFAGAEKMFNFALERDQNYIPAYMGKSLLYSKQGNRVKAVEEYDKIIAIEPGNSDAYVSKGLLYLNMSKRDLAAKNFTKACEMGNKSGCIFIKEMNE